MRGTASSGEQLLLEAGGGKSRSGRGGSEGYTSSTCRAAYIVRVLKDTHFIYKDERLIVVIFRYLITPVASRYLRR